MTTTCTITKEGRCDTYGRPLLVGQAYTSSDDEIKSLWQAGFCTVTGAPEVFEEVVYPYVEALLGDSEKRLIINASDSAEATVNTTVLITAASATWASEIGSTGKPAGSSGTNSDPEAAPNALKGLPWAADSGYPSGEADVASIFGGYDHVCNQLAGTIIGGGHNYIPYHAVGHGTIIGGSNNRNYGGRGTIAGTRRGRPT